MGISQKEVRMEGWLYLIRSRTIGLQYTRKRYFILQDQCLRSFKSRPTSENEDPVKSATIDSCIRAMDNGRERINRKVLFIFTLYNASNHNDRLKLGASSPEEAARWIHSFQEAAQQECAISGENGLACPKRKWQAFRLNGSKRRDCRKSMEWILNSSMHIDPLTNDVIAPSPWTIFGCQNGLRLFKEAKDRDFHRPYWNDHPAIMAVGVIDGTSEAIFQTVMSLGPSRSEWDFCIYRGSVVEHLDGHTDIIHKQLKSDWMPWGMKRRDLLLQRYWRREDDGTYVILYHSVYHKKCQPRIGYVRACLKSGGYVISPVNQGKQSVVKHMLAIDWKFWKSYIRTSSARSITIRMMAKIAALRELFRARVGNYPSSNFSSGELARDIGLVQNERENIKVEVQNPEQNRMSDEDDGMEKELGNPPSVPASLMGLNDTSDEFFDVPEPSDNDESESCWPSDSSPEMRSQDLCYPKQSTATGFVRKLHDLAIQKRGYVDLQDFPWEDGTPCCYGATLPEDPSCRMPCSWTTADPSSFLIRGESYLQDRHKIKATGTLMQMVAADWLRSEKQEDDLGGRPGGIVQKYAMKGGPEFFFIINIQAPGSTAYGLALYYMMSTPVEDSPLLESFINGDDSYRNSRFKLIPYISKGSWIVKQSVGKKAGLVGQALQINYIRGKNYLEANTEEELPEFLLGTCRLNHLDVSKAVFVKPKS
ncbi:protein ENHANCED DISEASE RESISTANCE 2-like isoform X2 [Macadamia integrifolia]|uniref:protein ENHANCED DISEASE RESISTANCE 2-like isoform X2 n=1 Tax=Macadamia integrifolia TaxID=60698 RepID=UPI001C52CF2E|nr:protein ENHANCED DISEASE RESISTANCE 2-like isoform X2 [Macadamia integrifolia]